MYIQHSHTRYFVLFLLLYILIIKYIYDNWMCLCSTCFYLFYDGIHHLGNVFSIELFHPLWSLKFMCHWNPGKGDNPTTIVSWPTLNARLKNTPISNYMMEYDIGFGYIYIILRIPGKWNGRSKWMEKEYTSFQPSQVGDKQVYYVYIP